MKYYIYENIPNAPKISTENIPFIYEGRVKKPLVLEGETLGIALNQYLDNQHSKIVSLSNLNLTIPDEEEDEEEFRKCNLSDLILSKYNEVILNNNNMENFSLENKKIKSLDLSYCNIKKSNFENCNIDNLIMDNTFQINNNFKKSKVNNFRAQSAECHVSDFSESDWGINKKYVGDKKYDFSFMDDVIRYSYFDLCKWEKTKISHDKALNNFRSPIVHGNIKRGQYVLKSMKNFGLKPALTIGFLEAGDNIIQSGIEKLPDGGAINTVAEYTMNVAELPLKASGHVIQFLLNHVVSFDNPVLNTVSVAGTTAATIGCMVLGQMAKDKLEEPLKKIGKFFKGKVSEYSTTATTKLANNFMKIKNTFSKGLTQVLFGKDRVTSKNILKNISQENHIKIGYGNQEYIVTDDKGAEKVLHKMLDEKNIHPFIISCVAKVRNAPDNVVVCPGGEKIFSWVDKKNNTLLTSVKYDKNGTILEKSGDFSNIEDVSYEKIYNKFIDNLDIFHSKNEEILKDIQYNKDTHRLVIHGDYARVLRKSDNAIDNDMDFAMVNYNKKKNKIEYFEFHDRKRGETVTINAGEPKPVLDNNILNNTQTINVA